MLRPLSRLWFVRCFIPALGDFCLLMVALAASFALRQPDLLTPNVFSAFLPLFGLWFAVFYASGLYEFRLVRDFVALVSGLLGSALVCWLLGTMYFYLLGPYFQLSPKTHLLLAIIVAHFGMLAWRRLILAVTDFSLIKLRMLILADSDHVDHLRTAIIQRSQDDLDLTGSLAAGVDLVVADAHWVESHWDEARRVFSAAVAQRVPIVSLDGFYESLFGKVSPLYSGEPAWALEHVLPRADSLYVKGKRLFDAGCAAAGLILLMPLLLLTALAIRCFDRMSPLYGQPRVGYLGRTFILWKFRTMRPGADADGPFQPDRESRARVTPLGEFLRRFRFDEFPQLWNVLLGDMSLVGPRPEWVKEVEILEKAVPNYHLRHLVPPGITGWAQVYYRATNDPKDSVEKHHYDLYYLKHFSPALDLTILMKTIKRIFIKDSRVSSVSTPFPRSARTTPFPMDIGSIINRN